MHPDLAKLIELQEVDAEIARLSAEVAALPKRVQAIETKLASAKDGVEKAKAAIKSDEMAKRKFEQEIQAQQDKIVKFREQSSSVKTNDQYKALMHEIGFAEQEIRRLEDKILEIMEAGEGRERQLKAAEAELKTEIGEVEKEKNHARELTAEDEKKLAGLNEKRSGLRGGISEDSLNHYTRVAKLRVTGIAEARDQRCMGCQVMLRPQVFAEVRRDDIVRACDSCSRLLYYRPENAAETGPRLNENIIERTWMFLPEMGEQGVFAVFINNKGNAQMRTFDAATGKFLEKHTEKGKSYHQAYAEILHKGRELFVHEAGLEDVKEQLPPEALEDLRRQLPDAPSDPPTQSLE